MAAIACHGKFQIFPRRLGVASQARHTRMPAIELEFGLNIVVEFPKSPTVGVVAQGALRSQPLFVLVILLVACDAIGLGLFELGSDVTILASGDSMHSYEGKMRQIVIELHLPSPLLLIVAALASLPLLSFMNVVGLMAVKAGFCKPYFFLSRLHMATAARRVLMGAYQGKVRLHIVFKFPFSPSSRAVAQTAFLPQAFFVDIVFQVTVNAIRRSLFISRCQMAPFTGDQGM